MGLTTEDKEEQAQALADSLLGTCYPMPDDVARDPDLCEHLDELILRCPCCDWWVKAHEVDDDGNCGDCNL